MQKDTEELKHELSEAESIEAFLSHNQENLRCYTLSEYLNFLLTEKELSKTEVIEKSRLEPVYAYHLFAGRKKNSSKEKMLSLALAMNLTPQEAQRLLYYAGAEQLYVRNSWDSILWYALKNHFTVDKTNVLLEKMQEMPLLGRTSG